MHLSGHSELDTLKLDNLLFIFQNFSGIYCTWPLGKSGYVHLRIKILVESRSQFTKKRCSAVVKRLQALYGNNPEDFASLSKKYLLESCSKDNLAKEFKDMTAFT